MGERLNFGLVTAVALFVLAVSTAIAPLSAAELKIEAVVFSKPGARGDFGWMRSQPNGARTYFIFNDNEEQLTAHLDRPDDPFGCAAGGGNAAIRPWQCESPPQAGGVPTGSFSDGGYRKLTDRTRALIDRAFQRIEADLRSSRYDSVVYSGCVVGSASCAFEGDLGTGIFDPAVEVRSYIVSKLRALRAPQ